MNINRLIGEQGMQILENTKFLRFFPKESNGLYMVYECFTFENFFRLILKQGLNHEDALFYTLINCSFSGYVWQEEIHNKHYLTLSGKDALTPYEAASKAIVINDILEIARKANKCKIVN